jgi:hypothetical protein
MLLLLWLAAGPIVDANDGAATNAWIKERISAAAAGKRELVRFPFTHHGEWGCMCPNDYMGTQDMSYPGTPYVKLLVSPGMDDPRSEKERAKDAGYTVIVEGMFTGRVLHEENEVAEGETEKYLRYEFQGLRWRPAHQDSPGDEKASIVLAGKDAEIKIPPLTDGKPFLVVVDSLALADKQNEAKALALRDKLRAAGYAGAEVIDSRAAPRLFCCYHVVVAGRYATRDAALAVAKELKKKKYDAGVRQGW